MILAVELYSYKHYDSESFSIKSYLIQYLDINSSNTVFAGNILKTLSAFLRHAFFE